MGADVYFAGYKIAILRGDVPATILGEVEAALDAYDPDAVSPEDYKAAKDDADRLQYCEREIAQLNGQISTLEAALKIASKRGKP
jgi:hypothetical protein